MESRFNHFDPIVDTERGCVELFAGGRTGFNHFDPIVDTERQSA